MERSYGDNGCEERLKTLVLLCESLEHVGNGLSLTDVSQWLGEQDSAVHVEVVADLCERPALAGRVAASGATRLVLGLCSAHGTQVNIDSQAREAQLDPLSVERVNLGGYCARGFQRADATVRAKALLAAAVARARAFPGSQPENVRAQLVRGGQRLSRRALFTLPPIRYQPVASIRHERCAGESGCGLCVEVCPWEAIARGNGRVLLDKSRCQACGLCITECPRRAIELPTASLPQIEAEMTELLRTPALDSTEPRAFLFVCEGNASALERLARKGYSYPLGWLPVQVPCVGMVSVAWMLGGLAWGAAAVGVLECGGDCPFGQHERIAGKVAYARELLGLLGGSPEGVRLLPRSPERALAEALNRPIGAAVHRREGRQNGPSFSGRRAAARAIVALAEAYEAPPFLSHSHPFCPLGLAQIDGEKCTACGRCAGACPTGALALRRRDGAAALTFDAALCTACEQCIVWCPEASEEALRIHRATDLAALSQGRATLYQSSDVRCESCGAPIGPTAMLRRIEAKLSAGGGATSAAIATITRRCPSCRVAGASERRTFAGS